jgi:hypothetical protein
MKHLNILKNEIDRAGSRSVDRSFLSRSISDPIKNRDLIGSASHPYKIPKKKFSIYFKTKTLNKRKRSLSASDYKECPKIFVCFEVFSSNSPNNGHISSKILNKRKFLFDINL